ncbi:OmpA family protein [Desulfocurvus sp. DL9XJH121]
MSKSKQLFILPLLFACLAVMLGAGPARAETKIVPKVDGFVFFADYSGSMAMTHATEKQKKISLAKQAMQAMNAKIPALGYQAGLDTFAPYGDLWRGPYTAAAMDTAVQGIGEDFPIFGRTTPMGDGLSSLRPVLDGMPGKVAVIIFSDGRNNEGIDPVAEASAMSADYQGRVCFHVVSFADEAKGQKILDDIAALAPCSVAASGPALLADQAAMDRFVRDVFYDEVSVAKKAMPKAAPKEEVIEVIELRINFDFDSATIRDDMRPILDEAAGLLKDADRPAVLSGHTCNIGPENYNQGLSERRAKSVKQYLVGKGIPAVGLGTNGYGETMPKYDNNTLEGRKLNRRVEIIIK